MAVTSIWAVKSRMDTVLNYIENPEKTTSRPELDADAMQARLAISKVIDYASNEDKTDRMMFVTGVNCDPDTALEEFIEVKQRWHKEGGRLAYHGYQSFLEGPGEITAEEAHEVGVELAKELWGDRFQVVVATHLNTGHYHNHFVLNSVSFTDGYKYVRFNSDYRDMQEVSDRLCRERGLHIIHNPSTAKGKSYDEWKAERDGKYTIRGAIREDIDYAVSLSRSWNDFAEKMFDLGYEFKFFGKDGQELAHPGLKPPGAKSYFRFRNLGADYDTDAIYKRIIKSKSSPGIPRLTESKIHVKEWEPPMQEMRGLPQIYRWYCFRLYTFVSKPRKRKEHISMYIREDIRKLDWYIEQLDFMYKHDVVLKSDISEVRTRNHDRLESLLTKREELYSSKKTAERAGNSRYVESLASQIKELSDQIKGVRHEIDVCDACYVDADRIVGNAAILEKQLTETKKPKSRGGWIR